MGWGVLGLGRGAAPILPSPPRHPLLDPAIFCSRTVFSFSGGAPAVCRPKKGPFRPRVSGLGFIFVSMIG